MRFWGDKKALKNRIKPIFPFNTDQVGSNRIYLYICAFKKLMNHMSLRCA